MNQNLAKIVVYLPINNSTIITIMNIGSLNFSSVYFSGSASLRFLFISDFCLFQILMDYLEGSSLADSISQPGMPIDVLKDYTKQLVHVLNYLHSKSIVHRDLQVRFETLM